MTVASAPRDQSFCVLTAIGQHAEVYSSAPAETLSVKVYVMTCAELRQTSSRILNMGNEAPHKSKGGFSGGVTHKPSVP